MNFRTSLLILPNTLLYKITYFLNNEDSCNLVLTCKNINIICKQNGYIYSICYNYNMNIINFIKHFHSHYNTIKLVKMIGILNPHLWIPKKIEKIIFKDCVFNIPFDLNFTNNLELINCKEFKSYFGYKKIHKIRRSKTYKRICKNP
jgi:hypothetical protein